MEIALEYLMICHRVSHMFKETPMSVNRRKDISRNVSIGSFSESFLYF